MSHHNRYEQRFFSHYQSHQGSSTPIISSLETSESLKPESVVTYLSPISNKHSRSNKENINMFEEVSNMLRQYQQNPLKKKSSLPMPDQKILKEMRRKLRSKQSHRGALQQVSDVIKLSPILKMSEKQTPFCHSHPSKKAKFFEFNQKQQFTQLYCNDCSIQKILRGKQIYPITELKSQKHRNILSDSGLPGRNEKPQSLGRTNFWSVDENSLVSSTGIDSLIPIKQVSSISHVDTFESCDEEQRVKELELVQFSCELESLKTRSEQLLAPTTYQSQAEKIQRIQSDLETVVRLISRQTYKLLHSLQLQSASSISQEQVRTAHEVICDLNSISQDVNTNRDNIMHQMQLKPFKQILNKYREKFHIHESLIQRYSANQNQMMGTITQLDSLVQHMDSIRRSYANGIEDLAESPQLTQMTAGTQSRFNLIVEDQIGTQRHLQKKGSRPSDHIYISFENKDLFLAAQRSSIPQQASKKEPPSTSSGQDASDIVQLDSMDFSDRRRNGILESPNFLRG